jgi:hypothetical protein
MIIFFSQYKKYVNNTYTLIFLYQKKIIRPAAGQVE